MDSVVDSLQELFASQLAILVAVGAGLLGLIVAFYLTARGSSSKGGERETKADVEEISSSQSEKGSKNEPQRKQGKVKNIARSRKASLPSHSLLAADFKGHTGAVLSLDFDSTGRYLVSCSEGISQPPSLVLFFNVSHFACRSHHSPVVHEDP